MSERLKTGRDGAENTSSVAARQVRRKTHKLQHRLPFDCVALLPQGGGAVGAYQAGVCEALDEADLQPDWVAGISIGAINCAIIAGNPRVTSITACRPALSSVEVREGQKITQVFGCARRYRKGASWL